MTIANAVIKKQYLNQEFYTDENCYITELSNSIDDPEISIARARVKPAQTTRWHRLTGVTERYYILSGQGIVEIGQLDPCNINPGDIVIIPPMCRQRITNTGDQDLVFLAICSPRFNSEVYQDIEAE